MKGCGSLPNLHAGQNKPFVNSVSRRTDQTHGLPSAFEPESSEDLQQSSAKFSRKHPRGRDLLMEQLRLHQSFM